MLPHVQAQQGFASYVGNALMSGLSWLGVEVMTSFPSSPSPSQAHPEPKRPAAAALNLAFISSREPKDSSILAFSASLGPLVLPGAAMHCQKKVWFQWPPPLLRTMVRSSAGTVAAE